MQGSALSENYWRDQKAEKDTAPISAEKLSDEFIKAVELRRVVAREGTGGMDQE